MVGTGELQGFFPFGFAQGQNDGLVVRLVMDWQLC
jgi:hypothetical protein